jgi:acyl carrier protein
VADDVKAAQVREIIRDHLSADADTVTDTASLIDDLGADSLDVVEVTIAIEDAFAIKISDAEANDATIVGDWIKLVETKTA